MAHPELSLVAYGRTAPRLRKAAVVVRLLTGTVSASTALSANMLRMQLRRDYLRT